MIASLKVQVPDSQRGSRKPFMKAPGLKRAWGRAPLWTGTWMSGLTMRIGRISYNWLFLSIRG